MEQSSTQKLNPVTVMLTASGSQFAPGIIKCLKKNGERDITVIGGDMCDDPTNRYLVDKFYQIPAARDPHYAEAIAAICQKEHVDILLPQMSAELPAYFAHLDLFQKAGTIVSMTRTENVNIANNKLSLFQFMDKNGIPTPQYQGVSSMEEFEAAVSEMGYPKKPICVKMTELSGSRGVRVIDESKSKFDLFAHEKPVSLFVTLDDMKEILEDVDVFPELMLMEYLPGDELNIDLLAEDGKVLYTAGRRDPVMLMSISQESILEYDERADRISRMLVEKLGLDGNIGFDFKYDADGKAQLLEINPRIDATVSIMAAGGLNLPYLRVKQLLGEKLPEVDVQYGTRLKRRYDEMFTNADGQIIDW